MELFVVVDCRCMCRFVVVVVFLLFFFFSSSVFS